MSHGRDMRTTIDEQIDRMTIEQTVYSLEITMWLTTIHHRDRNELDFSFFLRPAFETVDGPKAYDSRVSANVQAHYNITHSDQPGRKTDIRRHAHHIRPY